MRDSSIQWCNHTFNPWIGCTKVAPECKNCYAETQQDHRYGRVKWGKGQPRYRTSSSNWKQPLKWDRDAALAREPHRPLVFCASLGDWLDEEVPVEWLADLLALIYGTPNLNWLLLTKRPQNWDERLLLLERDADFENSMLAQGWRNGLPPENVWIGVSAGADQRAALNIPAHVHFLSYEPMLSPLDTNFMPTQEFDWIIFGGESGRNARLCHIDWIRDGVEFCRRCNIAPFVKQLGAAPVFSRTSDAEWMRKIKDSHGGDWTEWPEDLRVREFPSEARSLATARDDSTLERVETL